jgi:uncharacterized protein YecE (DUF72 family)
MARPQRSQPRFKGQQTQTPESRTASYHASHQKAPRRAKRTAGYAAPHRETPGFVRRSTILKRPWWDSTDIHERFGYRYTEAELTEWAPKVRALARDAGQTHVLFNTCYRDYAQVNAQQLAARLQS